MACMASIKNDIISASLAFTSQTKSAKSAVVEHNCSRAGATQEDIISKGKEETESSQHNA